MELEVLGCHGGEPPQHRTTAFLIGQGLAIDAGCLTSQLDLQAQSRLNAVLVSHAHLDHVRDLATIADNRCQLDCGPLTIAATGPTIAQLRAHFFNDLLWPNFAAIPSPAEPTIRYVELPLEQPTALAGYQITAVFVHHCVASAGFIVDDGACAIGISGDTGPTERFWELLNAHPRLQTLLMEVSFPNRQQALANMTGHHTPKTMAVDLHKYRAPADLPTLLYHIKPAFQAEVERECAELRGLNLQVLKLGDHFIL